MPYGDEPYAWFPTNSAEVIAFTNHVRGLSAGQRSLQVTFNDNVFVQGIRYGGVTLTNIRYGGINYAFAHLGMTAPAPPALAAWDAFKALGSARGIQFLASPNLEDLYEASPAEGTLTEAFPTDILTDDNFGFERIRAITASNRVLIDRGSLPSNARQFIELLPDDWTIYLLNEDDEEYVAWRANAVQTGGAGRVGYDLGSTGYVEIASNLATQYSTFLLGLADANVIVGMAQDASWRPYV